MIANAEVSLASGDIKKAISILKGVTADSPYFSLSRKKLADVYLKYIFKIYGKLVVKLFFTANLPYILILTFF